MTTLPKLNLLALSIALTGLIGCSDSTVTPIHDIQGQSDTSPLVNTTVLVDAIVVGDFQEVDELDGFFIQAPDQSTDNDPNTSEGIFVNQSKTVASDRVRVRVGDRVKVKGQVAEIDSLTQIVAGHIEVKSRNNRAPAPVVLTLPLQSAGALEQLEGMRVSLAGPLKVTDNYNVYRYGEFSVSSGSRLMVPTNVVVPGRFAKEKQRLNRLNQFTIDDGSRLQNLFPSEYPKGGLSAQRSFRLGTGLNKVTGVLSARDNNYKLQPTQPIQFSDDNPRSPTPPTIEGQLRVASFNVLNYFNGDGKGEGFPTSRGADNIEEFDRQRAKIIAAITAMDADVIGLMEIENDGFGPLSAIQDLVNGLNQAAPKGDVYRFISPDTAMIGTDQITVGLIYNANVVRPLGQAKILDSQVDPRFNDHKNRPSLAQSFEPISTTERLTVVVNHLKSKGSPCDELGDINTGDGQGNCNATRTAAVDALISWLAKDPTDSNDSDVLVIGDFNAYAQEDPIQRMEAAGYVDMIDRMIGREKAYSYMYRGQSGYLDHALVSPSLVPQVSGVTEWHINADEPRVLDYNLEYKSPEQEAVLYSADPYRASDHDPVIIGITLGDLTSRR